MHRVRCSRCGVIVEPIPPRARWKVASVYFWIGSLAVSTLFAMLLGLNVLLFPLAIIVASSVGASARHAHAWSCPRCGNDVTAPRAGGATERPHRRPAWRYV